MLKIDAKYVAGKEPALGLVSVYSAPKDEVPLVWLVACGPRVTDERFDSIAVAFPEVYVDGVKRSLGWMMWSGPSGPLKPGMRDVRLVRMGEYQPAVVLKAGSRVEMRVGRYRAEGVVRRR